MSDNIFLYFKLHTLVFALHLSIYDQYSWHLCPCFFGFLSWFLWQYLIVNCVNLGFLFKFSHKKDGNLDMPFRNVKQNIETFAINFSVIHLQFVNFLDLLPILLLKKYALQCVLSYMNHYGTTAAVAKEPLEGHCIYDGGYSYSERSRDYTIPDSELLALQQASLAGAATVWQNS
ncbi:unnamed protein product [Coffea canephora]|uniref:Uncharacterized protein n=1 Tax=Coffea canephora TaxID=49390 RepID=A0A068U142_COFCA|nr:unnamed protein product [Coffea canephora]